MRIYKGNHSYPFARVMTLCLTCLFAMSVMGQGHGNHLMVGVGASYPKGFEATLAYEHEILAQLQHLECRSCL